MTLNKAGPHRRRWLLLALSITALSGVGCHPRAPLVQFNLQTDYLPQVEFDQVQINVFAGGVPGNWDLAHTTHTTSIEMLHAFPFWSQVGEVETLTPGVWTVQMLLLHSNAEVARGLVIFDLVDTSLAVTVRIQHGCEGVVCPGDGGNPTHVACLDGMCVDGRCRPEAMEYCPPATCREDAHCASFPDMPCSEVCREGSCWSPAEGTDLCRPGEPRAIGPREVTPTPLDRGTLFASPEGLDTADCSSTNPCDIWTAIDRASGGEVVFLRGGLYNINVNLEFVGHGRTPAPTIFESYPGERAILDGGGDPVDNTYIYLRGEGVTLRLLEIRNQPRTGLLVQSNDNILEGLDIHDNLLSGIEVSSDNNLITDCTLARNSGAGHALSPLDNGAHSDGIALASGQGNRVENCLAFDNSNSGIDSWQASDTYIGYSIAYGNGLGDGEGVGISAGGSAPAVNSHVEHCICFNNQASGFSTGTGTNISVVRNTSSQNAQGFYSAADALIQGNLSDEISPMTGTGTASNNSWQRAGTPGFSSIDPTSPDFLRPTESSLFADLGAYSGR